MPSSLSIHFTSPSFGLHPQVIPSTRKPLAVIPSTEDSSTLAWRSLYVFTEVQSSWYRKLSQSQAGLIDESRVTRLHGQRLHLKNDLQFTVTKKSTDVRRQFGLGRSSSSLLDILHHYPRLNFAPQSTRKLPTVSLWKMVTTSAWKWCSTTEHFLHFF